MKKSVIIGAAATLALLAGCSSDADVASRNISQAAEQFEVERRIVFINGITDEYLLEIQGRCSVETSESALGGSLEVTCKIAPDQFKKHFLGLSDNVSYLVEQMDPIDVSVYHYRVIFKPSVIIPDVDAEVDQIPGLDGN
jgi:hypothetical protein